MNFSAAMKVLIGGGSVRFNNITYKLDEDGFSLVNVATEDTVALTGAMIDGTTYVAVTAAIPTLDTANEVFAVFNEEKARWVSTTEAAKHKAAGRRVAVFVLDELI